MARALSLKGAELSWHFKVAHCEGHEAGVGILIAPWLGDCTFWLTLTLTGNPLKDF